MNRAGACAPPVIRPFRPGDQAAVRALVLDGLREHWGTLDPRFNQDLDDIAARYAGAVFLVAVSAGDVVGCGALVPLDARTAEIRRMSVKLPLRRTGLGTKLLRQLLRAARVQGFERIVLETTTNWNGVVAFYLRNGFRVTHIQGEDTWFEYLLK